MVTNLSRDVRAGSHLASSLFTYLLTYFFVCTGVQVTLNEAVLTHGVAAVASVRELCERPFLA